MEPAPPQPRPAPRHWFWAAPVTRTIVALNIAVFVTQVALARELVEDETGEHVKWAAGAIARVPIAESLLFGANYAIATVAEHRVETLVTACFLHAGIVHLALNMLVLWQGGALVERAVGAARMAPMYLFAGVVSSALSTAVTWFRGVGTFSVGASGAIMGVLAAALVLGWRIQGWRGPLTQSMARWLGFNLVFGFLINMQGANIDNAAHIGGAIAGALVAVLWRRGVVYGPHATRLVLASCAALVFGSGAAVVARDALDPFASMRAEDRLKTAVVAVRERRCGDAFAALRSTEKLAPKDPDVIQLRIVYNARCGVPM